LISGCGSVGAIVGGTIPVFFHARWGWNGVFTVLAISAFAAGALLLPCWNALPASAQSPTRRKE
jgi:sugar phosphate permease